MSDIKNDLYNADMERIKRNRERLTYIEDFIVAIVGYSVENMDRVFYDKSGILEVVVPSVEYTKHGDYFGIEYAPKRELFTLYLGNNVTKTLDQIHYSLHEHSSYKALRMNLVGFIKDRLQDGKDLIAEFESATLFSAGKWFRNEQAILSFTSSTHSSSFSYIITKEYTHTLAHFDKRLSIMKYAELNPEIPVEIPEEAMLATEHSTTDIINGPTNVLTMFNTQVQDLLVETGNWDVLR